MEKQIAAVVGVGRLEAVLEIVDRRLKPRALLEPHVSPTLIGDNIKREREAHGWTAAELADHSDLDVLEVEAFEDGSLIIFPEQLVQLAGALGLGSPERLLEAA